MVSQQKRAGAGSRYRLLKSAVEEFAARGFDGAKVDRITTRARVNKAMLYYHFQNKAALYREIIGGLFRGLADAVGTGRDSGGSAETQLRTFIRTVARMTTTEPHFPAIWLREMAEGGRHLDATIATAILSILLTLKAILEEGHQAGDFKQAHPLITQMGIVAPLLLFAASAPARKRFGQFGPAVADVPLEAVIAHVETATLAALRAVPHTDARLSVRRPRR